jgi:predicted alpha/beta hydrolase
MPDALTMDAAAARVSSRPLTIAAEDGTPLAATLFEPAVSAPADAPLIAIGPAVAVPSRYYARFAAWLAERGHPVLTFDYRGIGGSRSGPLRGNHARMRDWCVLDTPGVIAWVADAHFDRPLYWIGHSMGGFATGLSHNNTRIARQLNIATLSGYWRRMARPERYRVKLLMGYVSPPMVWAMGYLPGVLIGGEDMPGPAYLEWARWCMQPEFIFSDPTLTETRHLAHFRAPIRFGQVEDDVWGTPAAVEHMAGHFTANVERSMWPIRLADAGASRIGHLGFFRPEFRDTLWKAGTDWLLAPYIGRHH